MISLLNSFQKLLIYTDDPVYYSNRANSYVAAGQTAEARADLLKTIELSEEPALTGSAGERLNSLTDKE